MVKIGLQFKATTEGITNLKASGEDFRWYLKQQTSEKTTASW
jgi:hypothetical protein